ncbi:unnamed protein product [Allacma fusca]|uniref:CB1 cannabinoid receptor-interacting protein 1 n=1 Tax=Allacma fusca TaxID=39272 RepID=A0A8J2J846_9HEXA|nr:unnamed protein product [Allacma fusca]
MCIASETGIVSIASGKEEFSGNLTESWNCPGILLHSCQKWEFKSLQVQNMEVQCLEKSRDRTASAYSAQYPTHGVPVSKNGVRHDIPVVMQLSEGGDLVVSLQVKFYKTQESNHSDWGSSLHCIEYECTLMPGIDRVIVTKETYRLTNSKPRLC